MAKVSPDIDYVDIPMQKNIFTPWNCSQEETATRCQLNDNIFSASALVYRSRFFDNIQTHLFYSMMNYIQFLFGFNKLLTEVLALWTSSSSDFVGMPVCGNVRNNIVHFRLILPLIFNIVSIDLYMRYDKIKHIGTVALVTLLNYALSYNVLAHFGCLCQCLNGKSVGFRFL